MRRLRIIFPVALFVLSLAVNSCKKYPEGPAFTVLSKKARITNKWKLDQITTEPGTDVTAMYKKYELDMHRDGYAGFSANIHFFGPPGYTIDTSGVWQFSDDMATIQFDFKLDPFDKEFEVLRLKNKELWLRSPENREILRFVPR